MTGIHQMFLAASAGEAQPAYWFGALASTYGEGPTNLDVASDGTLYIGGSSLVASPDTDIRHCLTKASEHLTIDWSVTLHSSGNNLYSADIKVDNSGNTLCLVQNSDGNYHLVKYDSSGSVTWQKTFTFTDAGGLFRIALDSSGNCYCVGYIYTGTTYYLALVKVDTSGTVSWTRRIANSVTTYFATGYQISIDSSDNIYISGYVVTGASGNMRNIVAKYNTSGTIQWQRYQFTTSTSYQFQGVEVLASGTIVSCVQVGADIYIQTHAASDGAFVAGRKLTLTDNYGLHLCSDSSSNVYLFLNDGYEGVATKTYIMKFNSSLSLQWQRSIALPSAMYGAKAYDIALGSDNSIYTLSNTVDIWSPGPYSVFEDQINRLPLDGTITGTYGSFTYAASSITDASSTVGVAVDSGGYTESSGTVSTSTSSLTASTISITSSKIAME